MKQIEFKQEISVPRSQVRGMFEVFASSDSTGNSVSIRLATGGTVNSFIPSNLIQTNGSLVSFQVSKNSTWYLVVKGTLTDGRVTSCTLDLVTTKPSPPEVTPMSPPTVFEFAIYAGIGSSSVRLIGPSPTLRTVIMYKEYIIKYDSIGSNYKDFYTVTFA